MIPKFRVWDIYEEEMCNDIFFAWQDCGYESLNECLSDNRFVFIQSTGLKDINGKEIYMGDLVKCDLNINDTINERVYEIVNNGFELILRYDFMIEWRLSECINSVEVIGNIFQNPNLLEADSNDR